MKTSQSNRTDEVSQYYEPAVKVVHSRRLLFWVVAFLSLCMPYSATVGEGFHNSLKGVFIVFVLVYFAISQLSRFWLVPLAEEMRRKQILSDSFGTPLSHDKTSLYYNNDYSPSVCRLGANTMENTLFSKEVAARMLWGV
ncbi:MAG: hypothetical protein PHI06_14225 [Desulfobulbaceae bacterium]|nr:hypothetical protein [Desulfobulbaceae bacterium]